ncbi:MAG TPA: hypothetical protein EYO20_02325 [Gemmatimonadetes bacterium]|jgi:hypothetical protein|nr:hypothetical protein [Gemmatimonadota bacterium]
MDIEVLFYVGILLWFVFGSLLGRGRKNKRAASPVPVESDYTVDTSDSAREREASEIIPRDLWAEITGLAVGKTTVKGTSVPDPEPVQESRKPRSERSSHIIHSTHPEYGTDPSERAPAKHFGLGYSDQDVSVVRSQLGLMDPDALRRAVILHEVLGPPIALREEQKLDTITSRLWPSF